MADDITTEPDQAATADGKASEDWESSAGKGGKSAVLADLAAERDARKALEKKLADLEPLAAKARELEESQKSEQQKLTERLQQAESEAAKARAEAERLKVAAEVGIPAELHEFLTATDADTLRAQAEKLKAVAAAAAPKPVDLGQGQRGPGKAAQLTRADLASMTPDQIVQAKADGRLNTLLGITK